MQDRIVDQIREAVRPSDGVSPRDRSDPTDAVRDQLERLRQGAERFVCAHPVVCLGAALVGGIAFGWWVKRK
jgi:hypothetical protein